LRAKNSKKKYKVYLRFYEELNDYLPPEKRKIRFIYNFTDRQSVKDLIESLGVPHIDVDLILVRDMSVDFSYKIKDGDLISVYPVFEAFDIINVQHLREKPLREPKFVVDIHIGKLARYMRLLGFDTEYRYNYSDEEIVDISKSEKRTILTRDRDLLKRNDVTHGYWLRNESFEEQLKEVIKRFDLENEISEFSRCLVCNTALEKIEKEKIRFGVPQKVIDRKTDFSYCPACDKVYWKGRHYERMRELIDELNI
jgi:uncharacterized protein